MIIGVREFVSGILLACALGLLLIFSFGGFSSGALDFVLIAGSILCLLCSYFFASQFRRWLRAASRRSKGFETGSPSCAISPADRRNQVRLVGNDLVKHYGRKLNYSVAEIKQANQRQGILFDVSCWSFATFSSFNDFNQYHQSIGANCDYVAMKSEMLSSVSNGNGQAMFDTSSSWLEFPDVDWSLFDFLDSDSE